MSRKPFWPALPGILVGIVFLFIGFQFVGTMSSSFSDPPLFAVVFPYVWIGLVLFITLRSIWMLFNGPPSNLNDGHYHNGYIKENRHSGAADRLRELDLMRQDGTVTEDEYLAKKQDILDDL